MISNTISNMNVILPFFFIFLHIFVTIETTTAESSSSCQQRVFLSSDMIFGPCSSEFQLITSKSSYSHDEPVEITVQSLKSDRFFTGVHLFAENNRGELVGSWKTNDSQLERSACQSLSHRSSTPKTSVHAFWFSSADQISGVVQIKAILIENSKIVYQNCYHISLIESIREDLTTLDPPNGKTSAPSPTADVALNVSWTFNARTNVTQVKMTIKNLKASEWAAIGLAMDRSMGKAHVFMCKRLADNTISISRYINPSGHQYPEPADDTAGGVLTPIDQTFRDGLVICQFNLSNFTSYQNKDDPQAVRPLSQSTPYYPIFGVGLLDSDNDPQKHAKDSRAVQTDLVQLDHNAIILYKLSNSDLTTTKLLARLHGILMTITWIFLVSTGILLSRYFKRTTHLSRVCCGSTWFTLHRTLMCLATILSTLAFILILVSMQGTWIECGWTKSFVHSILGAIVISLAFVQPFIALFRCEPTGAHRFIFNAIHTFVGFLALILSMIVLFLATSFTLFPNNLSRWLIISWISWVGCIFLFFEIIERCYRQTSNITEDENMTQPLLCHQHIYESRSQQKWKISLLILHLIFASTVSIILIRFLI